MTIGLPSAPRLRQFGHWPMLLIDQIVRTTVEVRDGGVVDVDAQVLIQSGEYFLEVDRAVDWFFGITIRFADDLSDGHATTSQPSERVA